MSSALRTKPQLRRHYRDLQRRFFGVSRREEEHATARHIERVIERTRPACIASYRALPRELSLDAMPAQHSECTWLFPRVCGRDLEFVHAPDFERDFQKGVLGLQEPLGVPVDPNVIELLLMPAVACDTRGVRLGQGGGYYDRFLHTYPALAARSVAVLFTFQVAPEPLPFESHDQRIAFMATAEGISEISQSSPGDGKEPWSGFTLGGHDHD